VIVRRFLSDAPRMMPLVPRKPSAKSGSGQLRDAVAIVVRRGDGAFLSVRRPSDDPHLPSIWGLPAVNLAPSERPEQAAVRAAKQKLGVDAVVRRRVGCETVDRPSFRLRLTEFEVDVVKGKPAVPQSDRSITQYVDCRYSTDPASLIPGARIGSACCRVFLREHGLTW
jgi:8-oxo-dGTP pyrophosphatase MutT (NUDIX family)